MSFLFLTIVFCIIYILAMQVEEVELWSLVKAHDKQISLHSKAGFKNYISKENNMASVLISFKTIYHIGLS